ncbi:MAG TPA: membrane dipeptidase, partial [Rhizomicrobium sp.]
MVSTRRDMLGLAALGAAAATAAPAANPAKGRQEMMIINALGGLENPNLALTRPQSDNPLALDRIDLDARTIRDGRGSGLTAANITLGYVGGPEEPFEETVRTIGMWDEVLRAHPHDLLKIYSAADILRAKSENRIGVIYGFQNGAMMGKEPSRVDIFADLGVRVFQLTYNPANQLGGGSMAPENMPLTDFGRQVVARLNERRMMVDLSHS